MRRRRRSLVPLLVLLLPVLLLVGIWLGGHPSMLPGFMRDALVGDDQAQVYDEAMELIQRDYYRKVDRDELLDKSLGAAVKSLNDQFSNYFSPADYRDFQQATEGQFEGVGMTVREVPRGLEVLSVFDGGPAEKAGLRGLSEGDRGLVLGDVIVGIDGAPVADYDALYNALDGKKPGEKVKVDLLRGGQKTTVEVAVELLS